MINALSKIWGRKKSGGNEQNNGLLTTAPTKTKETIWQKATSLRQSLRYSSSKSKVGQKTGTLPDLSYIQLSTDHRKVPTIGQLKNSILRREWGSQRNLARERRSLAAAPKHPSERSNINKRSLHARSFCVSGDERSWDLDVLVKSVPEGIDRTSSYLEESHQSSVIELPRHQRSNRKLTKDSGYETSAQGDPDYINTLSDWLSEENALNQDNGTLCSRISNEQQHSDVGLDELAKSIPLAEKRLEWNSRHRPLSFSHQEVPIEKKNRQLRHSYSQREVSSTSQCQENHLLHYPIRPVESYKYNSVSCGLKLGSRQASVESVSNHNNSIRQLAKSTPHLHPPSTAKGVTSSSSNLHPEILIDPEAENMVTRRFKKGSVYDALASTSGLDFSPVVQLKTYHSRREDPSVESVVSKSSPKKSWDNNNVKCSNDQNDELLRKRMINARSSDGLTSDSLVTSNPLDSKPPISHQPPPKHYEEKSRDNVPENSATKESGNCVTTHEKYPSWPVTNVESNSSATFRSHSWTGHTDYPKEKVGYLRPKKSFKISTNQLQPVLEKSQDGNSAKRSSSKLPHNEFPVKIDESNGLASFSEADLALNSKSGCDKPFDFEAFHTPCVPRCYGEKDYNIHSPPQRDLTTNVHKVSNEVTLNNSNSFLSKYENVLRQQAQYSTPLTVWNKPGSENFKEELDTPFLDRLRMDNAKTWPHSPPPPPPPPQLPLPQSPVLLVPPNGLAPDIELSSENGTWMGSMESSSHGRGLAKWQGSYSDLSTLSTQLSNRSSLFDSGHSTMPESGRLSPQSSCGSIAPSLLLEGPTRAQVVARHGCHREIVAHSARVQQPERHGSESVLYYAASGLSRPKTALSFNIDDRVPKSPEPIPGPSGIRQNIRNNSLPSEPPLYTHRSQASVVLNQNNSKNLDTFSPEKYSPKRETRNSNSISSEDSACRGKDGSEDTSESSSDVSNVTCISNYRERSGNSNNWNISCHYPNASHQSTKGNYSPQERSYNLNTNNDNPSQSVPQPQISVNHTIHTRESPKKDSYRLRSNASSNEIVNRKKQDQGAPRVKNEEQTIKSRSMDEASRKLLYPDVEKRQRISEPDLKTIQKQAVFSFYQRMSLAESVKSSSGQDGPIARSPTDSEPPPPYEASSSNKLRMFMPKISLLPNKYQPQGFNDNLKQENVHPKQSSLSSRGSNSGESSPGLLNNHSKSVPNLMNLKAQSIDLPPGYRPVPKPQPNQAFWTNDTAQEHLSQKRGSPLSKDEIISWDQLPSVLEKQRELPERANPVAETKDPPEDGNNSSSGASNYFKSHKSPRKVQLKEVHHSNETASVKVITPDGVTLVQTSSSTATNHHPTTKSKEDKTSAKDRHHHHPHHHRNNDTGKVPHKRRPAPPPPPKQPPKRPPPPPPPESPEPSNAVVVILDKEESAAEDVDKELHELRIGERNGQEIDFHHQHVSSSSPHLLGSYGSLNEVECCSSPDLPLPPPPPSTDSDREMTTDEPLPPPPETLDVNLSNRTIDGTSLVYPKNSYMSYRSEKKLGRQGFDGNYRRSFHASTSSVDSPPFANAFLDANDMLSPTSWEQIHNIRQHGTTVIFHSGALQCTGDQPSFQTPHSCQDFPMDHESPENGHISTNHQSESHQNGQNSQCAVPFAPSQEMNGVNSVNSNENRLPSIQDNPDEVNSNELQSHNVKNAGIDYKETTTNSLNYSSHIIEVDQNQNAVHLSKCDNVALTNNNSDIMDKTNNSVQKTTNIPRLKTKNAKTKQELECERLSRDFIHRFGDVMLKNLLVPAANHKTMSDYMEGLAIVDTEQHPRTMDEHFKSQNGHCEEKVINSDMTNGCNSNYMQQNHSIEILDSQSLNDENELHRMQEELLISIKRKIENLQKEQQVIREDMQKNDQIGKEILSKIQQLAKPNEIEKYTVHVEEMEKIMNLLLSLSGRLARAVNLLENLPKDASPEEKRVLIAKRDKLLEQHEDARRLKESIDRRSNQVSIFLQRYLSNEEFADYDFFIKMKTKLIVDTKEIDEKINFGEQQFAALRNIMESPQWKSANS